MEHFANLAEGTLSAGISNSDSTLTLQTGEGAEFPSADFSYDNSYFWLCLIGVGSESGQFEIVRVVSKSSDTLSIIRGQQGTTAQAFSSGTRAALRVTRDTLRDLRSSLVLGTGWSSGNYLNTGTGENGSATAMTLTAMARLGRIQSDTTGKVLAANGTEFTSGLHLRVSNLRPSSTISLDGNPYSTGGTDPNWSPGLAGTPLSYGFIDWKSVVMSFRWTNTDLLSVHVNGIMIREIDLSGVSPGTYAPGSAGFRVGMLNNGTQVFDGGIAGMSYVDGALTDDQISLYHRRCMEECDVIDDGFGFSWLWSFKHLNLRHGDTCPATIVNISGGSSWDMTRTGTINIVEEKPRWL
jgi:hypothetical protein